MRTPFPLPILFLLFALTAKAAVYNGGGHAIGKNIVNVQVRQVTASKITDSIPPKTSLLKKLLQDLQFRKNARAREETRVLNIIARSGVQDSLQTALKQLGAIDSAQERSAQDIDSILAILAKINGPKRQAPDHKGSGKGINSGSSEEDSLLPVDEQSIQALVSKMLNPLSPDEQARLNLLRWMLQRGGLVRDTVKVNDSLVDVYRYQVRKRLSIIGFYPFQNQRKVYPNVRLFDEVAWYSASFSYSGHLSGALDWRTSPVLDSAATAGARLSLCVQNGNRELIRKLLGDTLKQETLINDIIGVLGARHADGVNILLDSLPSGVAGELDDFVSRLSTALKHQSPGLLLSIRIPADAPENTYHMASLNRYVDRFLVNFAEAIPRQPGPLAPLNGEHQNDLKYCISRYLNMQIPAAKLVACLPYFGVRWGLYGNQKPQTIAYTDLRSDPEYQQFPKYESQSATERLDLRSITGKLTGRLWYDDDVTLAAKYDFILANRLGGILIDTLGDDEGCGELWDVMAAKLTTIDTTLEAIPVNKEKPKALDDWQWSWTYVNAKLEQYVFLFSYPCETSFPHVLTRKWEEAGLKNNDRHLIRREAETVIGVLSMVLGLLFVAGVLLFVNRIRRAGEKWKGIKPLAAVLIALFILLTAAVFMYLFLNKGFVFFGTADDAADCFDFPLGILSAIIFAGILIGVLITRFLVFPLLRKDDIP